MRTKNYLEYVVHQTKPSKLFFSLKNYMGGFMCFVVFSLFIISCQKESTVTTDILVDNHDHINIIDPSTIFTINSSKEWREIINKIALLEGDKYLEFEKL